MSSKVVRLLQKYKLNQKRPTMTKVTKWHFHKTILQKDSCYVTKLVPMVHPACTPSKYHVGFDSNNAHCWQILWILVLAKVASKTQYSPLWANTRHFESILATLHRECIHLTSFLTSYYCLVVLFNNAYPVRSAISVWCFTRQVIHATSL